MPPIAKVIVGVVVLLAVTFGRPFDGNVLGFCPLWEGPKAVGVDIVVAALDAASLWLIYRGVRL